MRLNYWQLFSMVTINKRILFTCTYPFQFFPFLGVCLCLSAGVLGIAIYSRCNPALRRGEVPYIFASGNRKMRKYIFLLQGWFMILGIVSIVNCTHVIILYRCLKTLSRVLIFDTGSWFDVNGNFFNCPLLGLHTLMWSLLQLLCRLIMSCFK